MQNKQNSKRFSSIMRASDIEHTLRRIYARW